MLACYSRDLPHLQDRFCEAWPTQQNIQTLLRTPSCHAVARELHSEFHKHVGRVTRPRGSMTASGPQWRMIRPKNIEKQTYDVRCPLCFVLCCLGTLQMSVTVWGVNSPKGHSSSSNEHLGIFGRRVRGIPRGSSDRANQPQSCLPALLESRQKSTESRQNSKGGVIVQNFGPPEAAPLLDHFLKIATTKQQCINIIKIVCFFKTLAHRKQH